MQSLVNAGVGVKALGDEAKERLWIAAANGFKGASEFLGLPAPALGAEEVLQEVFKELNANGAVGYDERAAVVGREGEVAEVKEC